MRTLLIFSILAIVSNIAVANEISQNEPLQRSVETFEFELPLAEVHTISVVDSAARAVEGAKVTVYGVMSYQDKLPLDFKKLYETITGANGKFDLSEDILYPNPITIDPNGNPVFDETISTPEYSFILVEKAGFALKWDDMDMLLHEMEEKVMVLNEPATLAGVVVDESGKVVAGAKVNAVPSIQAEDHYLSSSLTYALSSVDQLSCVTDRNGNFFFKNIPGNAVAEFKVEAEGYTTTYTWNIYDYLHDGKYEANAEDIVLTLKSKTVVEGVVVDKTTGEGVGDVSIVLLTGEVGSDSAHGVATTSDESGNFGFECEPGKHSLFANYYRIGEKNWASDVVEVEAVTGRTSRATLKVSPASILEFAVTETETGDNCKGRIIFKSIRDGRKFTSYTDDNGFLQLSLLPGEYLIESLWKPDYEVMEILETVHLPNGGTMQVPLQVGGSTILRGTVTDSYGNPIRNAEVYVVPGQSPISITDSAGRFEVEKGNLRSDLEEWSWGAKYVHTKTRYLVVQDSLNNAGAIKIIPAGVGEIDVQLTDGLTVTGRVVEKSGRGIAGAVVRLVMTKYDPEKDKYNHKEPLDIVAQEDYITDSSGFYQIGGIARGPVYKITACAEGFGTDQIQFVTNKTDGSGWYRNTSSDRKPKFSTTGFRIDQPPIVNNKNPDSDTIEIGDLVLPVLGYSVSGVVVDTMANPVADIKVEVSGASQPVCGAIRTDQDGRFVISGLTKGEVSVAVGVKPEDDEYLYYPERVKAQAGDDQIKIIVRPCLKEVEVPQTAPADGGLVKIKIVDAITGEPVDESGFSFRSKSTDNSFNMYSGPEGTIEVVLPSGEATMDPIPTFGYKKVKKVERLNVANGQEYEFVFELEPKATVSGTVVDSQGFPIARALVEVFPEDMEDFRRTTTADGKFSFAWYDESGANKEEHLYLVVTHLRRKLATLVELEDSSAKDMTIVLKPATMISGVVTDSQGNPLKSVYVDYEMRMKSGRVGLWYDDDEIVQKATNALGEYETFAIWPVPDGYTARLELREKGKKKVLWQLNDEEVVPGQMNIKDIVLAEKPQ